MIATRWRGKQWVGLPRPPSCTHGNSLSSSEKEGESVNVASSPTEMENLQNERNTLKICTIYGKTALTLKMRQNSLTPKEGYSFCVK